MVLTGVAFGLYRFIFGLAAATNLDQEHPWGLWIAMDVGSGIALAGGGFVTAAVVHIFHREKYHAIARSALLTALLGYTFYVPGLLADLGRWYNLWHPTIPTMWQGNSVLFEVGLCVMIYLNVQYAEMIHAVVAMLFVAAMLGHIYIGTIGMEGAFEAMGEGTVDVNWAKEHHRLWLQDEMRRSPKGARAQPAE
jgi:Ni/Fe-hydrogenase subunit HybB-like protein